MATNLSIDPDLLEEALKVGRLRTKKETVNLALKEFVNRRKQFEITELFGTMDPDPGYDYKKARQR
jgi:Arc/MetJ family transcription regulator